MVKYNFELKKKIVQEYIKGQGGYRYLANKYQIKHEHTVKMWINSYLQFGFEGLLRKKQYTNYSVQFKINAIDLYLSKEMSYREVANKIGINNPALIANWMQKFRKTGIEGLSKKKGRPSKMTSKKEDKLEAKQIIKLEERSRIKELEKQVRMLQIENAFLKELRRLREQETQRKTQKSSQKLSQASEDHSN